MNQTGPDAVTGSAAGEATSVGAEGRAAGPPQGAPCAPCGGSERSLFASVGVVLFHRIIPAATVVLVASSIRMKLPVPWFST